MPSDISIPSLILTAVSGLALITAFAYAALSATYTLGDMLSQRPATALWTERGVRGSLFFVRAVVLTVLTAVCLFLAEHV